MKKLVLYVILISMVSFVKVAAFDYTVEWEAITAIFEKSQAACFANKNSEFNKRMLLEIVRLIIDNYKDFKEERFKSVLFKIGRRELIGLNRDLKSELKNKLYDDIIIISNIRKQMIAYINKHYEFDHELIISKSCFLSDREESGRVIDFNKPALEEGGPILKLIKKDNANKKSFIYSSNIISPEQIETQYARMDLDSFDQKYKKLEKLPDLNLSSGDTDCNLPSWLFKKTNGSKVCTIF